MNKLLQPGRPDSAPAEPVPPASAAVEPGAAACEAQVSASAALRGLRPVCCLLGASFTTRNLGVSALASGTVASILSAFPEAQIFLLDYDKSPAVYPVRHAGGTAEVELVNMRFSWRVHLRNNIARLLAVAWVSRLLPRKLREKMISRHPYLRRLQQADLIVSLAGGDSFSDIYGMRRLLYVTLPQLLVLALKRPLVLLPQTLGPFDGRLARCLGGHIMRRARRVYARDRESLEEVRPLVGPKAANLAFSYDMAFLLKPIPPRREPAWAGMAGDQTVVGLNVSGLLYFGGYTRNNMFGLRADYRELMRELIAHFVRRKNAHVVLVPHVFGAPGDPESDPAACAALHRELPPELAGKVHLIEGEFDQHEIKHLIGRCHFFLGSRMHACIAALSQGVPAIGLAYSRKFLGVLRTVGAEELVLDLRALEVPQAMERIENIYAARARVQADLARRMPTVERAVAGLFPRIMELGRSDG